MTISSLFSFYLSTKRLNFDKMCTWNQMDGWHFGKNSIVFVNQLGNIGYIKIKLINLWLIRQSSYGCINQIRSHSSRILANENHY